MKVLFSVLILLLFAANSLACIGLFTPHAMYLLSGEKAYREWYESKYEITWNDAVLKELSDSEGIKSDKAKDCSCRVGCNCESKSEFRDSYQEAVDDPVKEYKKFR